MCVVVVIALSSGDCQRDLFGAHDSQRASTGAFSSKHSESQQVERRQDQEHCAVNILFSNSGSVKTSKHLPPRVMSLGFY